MTDILIPIYNGYHYVHTFFNNLSKSINPQEDRVILIDDGSSDECVKDYLHRWIGQHPNSVLLRNETRLGYGACLNKGLQYPPSDHDVIVLDLSMNVAPKWSDGLRKGAEECPTHAIISPMAPQYGMVPTRGMTSGKNASQVYEMFADQIMDLARGNQIVAPWHLCYGVYIRRMVLKKIGLFNESMGRETLLDFFCRAEQAGFLEYITDRAWIPAYAYFFDTLSPNTKKYILKRFPVQNVDKKSFDMNHELCRQQDTIRLHILHKKLCNKRKNILYISHTDFRIDVGNHLGGVQSHLRDMTEGIKNKFNVFVAARDGEYLRVTAYFDDARLSFQYEIGPAHPFPIKTDERLRKIFATVLQDFAIDAVHVHQVSGLSLDIFELAAQQSLPLFFTVHDYYFICPNLILLDPTGKECIGKDSPEICGECLEEKSHILSGLGEPNEWRKACGQALEKCTEIYTPSASTKRVLLHYYPQLQARVLTIEHGVTFGDSQVKKGYELSDEVRSYIDDVQISEKGNLLVRGWAYLEGYESKKSQLYLAVKDEKQEIIVPCQMYRRDDLAARDPRYAWCGFYAAVANQQGWMQNSALAVRSIVEQKGVLYADRSVYQTKYVETRGSQFTLHIGFIGGLNQVKGTKIIKQLIASASTQIQFVLIGGIDDPELQMLEQPNIVRHGRYRREELPNLILKYDLDMIGIFSTCSETFCYTLSEAVSMRLPVMVTDIGALGERVRAMQCGWVFPVESCAQQAAQLLDKIVENPDILNKVSGVVQTIPLRTEKDMVTDYLLRYEQITSKGKTKADVAVLEPAYLLAHPHQPKMVSYGDFMHLRNLLNKASDHEKQLMDDYDQQIQIQTEKLKALETENIQLQNHNAELGNTLENILHSTIWRWCRFVLSFVAPLKKFFCHNR